MAKGVWSAVGVVGVGGGSGMILANSSTFLAIYERRLRGRGRGVVCNGIIIWKNMQRRDGDEGYGVRVKIRLTHRGY